MSFRACEREDPFTKHVRELYRANVIKAPRANIEPLHVLAMRKRRVELRGRLEHLVDANQPVDFPGITSADVAEMSGLRSASLDLTLGVSLTATFLSALGVGVPGANLEASLWKGATSLEFEVREVRERSVDVAALGTALTGRTIQRNSPASEIFFGQDGVRMLIITRTFTSPQFAVRAASSGGQSVKVGVDAIEDLFGDAKVGVAWTRESTDTIAFRGATPVTFAFAAVPCVVQGDGSFFFGMEADGITFGPGGAVTTAQQGPVVDQDGLLDLDDPDREDPGAPGAGPATSSPR